MLKISVMSLTLLDLGGGFLDVSLGLLLNPSLAKKPLFSLRD